MALAIGADGPDTALAGRTGSALHRAGNGVIGAPWPAGCGVDATINGPDAPDLHTSIASDYVDRSGAPARQVDLLMQTPKQNRSLAAKLAKEARYRLAVRAFHGAPYESHLDTGYGYRDPRAYQILGLRPEEGEPTREWWFARVHPDDLHKLRGAVDDLAQGRASELDVEYRIRHRTGRWVWIWQRGLLIRDEAGRPHRLYGALLAITERKEAEAALRQSELLKSSILTSALDCIITIDQDSRVLEWNPASERTFGRRREDAIGRDLAEMIIPPELRERHRRGMAHYLATGDGGFLGKRVEVVGVRSDGSRIPIELAVSPIQISGQLYFTAYLRDLTERNRAAAALRENEQRLRATYENAFVGIAEVDQDRRFTRVNENFCKLTGYNREELLQLTFLDITHPEDRSADDVQFSRQMAGEVNSYSLEKRYVHKNGREVWIELLASRVDGDAGKPLYGIRIARDISERRRAERHQLLLMDELNHRVKNTLAIVQSIVSQSLKHAISPQEAREAVEARLYSLSRANDVLTGGGWESADLREIVARAVEPYRGRSRDRFILDLPAAVLPPRHALAFSMVLHELSTNAVKYGSLSNSTGMVSIKGDANHSEDSISISLTWEETGGPAVALPERRGFGSSLIESSFNRGPDCSSTVRFLPTGVVCTLQVRIVREGGASFLNEAT